MAKFFTLVCVCFAISTAVCAVNDGKNIPYNGETFTVSVFNQDVAEKEIASAKHVYCFKLADFELNIGNTADNWDCMINPHTKEYAITNYIRTEGKTLWYAIIFSETGARMIEFNPSTKDHLPGFEYADPSEVGFVGCCSKAGYANADLNGVHNSIVVFIK